MCKKSLNADKFNERQFVLDKYQLFYYKKDKSSTWLHKAHKHEIFQETFQQVILSFQHQLHRKPKMGQIRNEMIYFKTC